MSGLVSVFGVQDMFNVQYGRRVRKTKRDMEITRLKSVDLYVNPASEPNEPTVPYFACKFCPQSDFSNVFAVADELGNLSFLDVNCPQRELVSIKALNNAIFDIKWMPGCTKILALCGDHTSRLYDVGEAHIALLAIFNGHAKSVKSADFMPHDPAVFATGSRDGCVNLYDSRASNKSGNKFNLDQRISCAAGSSQKTKGRVFSSIASVTALAFQDRHSLLVAGSTDEFIRIWDMRLTYCPSRETKPKCVKKTRRRGYNDVVLSPDHTKLYASSIGGPISSFNLHSPDEDPIAEFKGHDSSSFYVKTCISSDGEYLASGSTDRAVHVWRTSGAEAEMRRGGRRSMLTLPGHRAEVTGVDISLNPALAMVSCAEDGTVRSWLPTATYLDHQKETHDIGTILAELTISDQTVDTKTMENRCELIITPSTSKSSEKEETPSKSSILRHHTPPRKAVRTSEISSASAKRRISEDLLKTDSKRQTLSPMMLGEYTSPTMNLPNYVEQGTGPCHSCPKVRQKENQNWLTEMRRKSADKRSSSVDKERRRLRNFSKKCPTRKTLLEYYKKSSKGSDESVKCNETEPNTALLGI